MDHKKTIKHEGIIEKIGANHCTVRILQASACSSCSARQLCRSSESKEKLIDVKGNYIVAYKADGSNGTATFRHKVADKPNATLQDQGGLIVGTNGEVIVPLKEKSGLKGGLYAVGTDGAISWEYRTGTGVSGAAALDNAGNIHFADESGFYYIIKPDYAKKSATLVLKVRTVDLMRNAGIEIAENYSKVWSSVMLDKSGKIYLATNLSNQCYVLRMSYHGTTGMGTSMWPVKFGNQYHSGQPNIAK